MRVKGVPVITGDEYECTHEDQLLGADHVAVDIETAGLSKEQRADVKLVAFSDNKLVLLLDPRKHSDAIRSLLDNLRCPVIHNAVFDVPILVRQGLADRTLCDRVVDTLLLSRLARPGEHERHGLEMLASTYLEWGSTLRPQELSQLLGVRVSEVYAEMGWMDDAWLMGAANDVLATIRLLPILYKDAGRALTTHKFGRWGADSEQAKHVILREQKVNRLFLHRTCLGVRVDFDRLAVWETQNAQALSDALDVLSDNRVTPGNSTELIAYLEANQVCDAKHPRTEKTKRLSTNKNDLLYLRGRDRVVNAYLSVKEIEKVTKDYIRKVVDDADEDGRSHPEVSVLAAATGRMSVRNPPIQQFPPEARGVFLAEENDRMCAIDLRQIEPVVAANIANDLTVLEQYESGEGDFYTQLTEGSGISRKEAKVVVLALLYGEGARKLAEQLTNWGGRWDDPYKVEDAQRLKRQVLDALPRVARLIERMRELALRDEQVFTISGRILPVPSGDWGIAVHKAMNYLVQGSAYDVMSEALASLYDQGLSDQIYFAVHDEIVCSVKIRDKVEKALSTPPQRMRELLGRNPVLRVSSDVLGERWGKA
jgi:DNA polymerase-1